MPALLPDDAADPEPPGSAPRPPYLLLHVPAGYTAAMFSHLPSRTVFIDNDRYVSDDSLGYWIAHELGHLAANSAKEEDAEKAAREYRKRLKKARIEAR